MIDAKGRLMPASMKNYSQAVGRGAYQKDQGGLEGKFDNVRRFWENEATRSLLAEYAAPILKRRQGEGASLRALDLGSGSGEGYELLLRVAREAREEGAPGGALLEYKGLDLCADMVAQGNLTYQQDPRASFELADLSQGLGLSAEDQPYDLYFSCYGSLSHLSDAELEALLGQVMDHAQGRFVFMADMLGRYSPEWPSYWAEHSGKDARREYSMSYLYPRGSEEARRALRFPIRFWGGAELDALFRRTAARRGWRVLRRRLRDRSVFVGRHTSTGLFNSLLPRLRDAVNQLFEPDLRTDLESLLVQRAPSGGPEEVDNFFSGFGEAWNSTVRAAMEVLEHWERSDWLRLEEDPGGPSCLWDGLPALKRAALLAAPLDWCDGRACIFEPLLARILRGLESRLERGLGAGHGLLAAYELEKR